MRARWLPLVLAAGCARPPGAVALPAPAPDASRIVELAELELRSGGPDRFVRCPAPGGLLQSWIPEPQPALPGREVVAPPVADELRVDRAAGVSVTEEAVRITYKELRGCFRKALVRTPAQDGRVALLLRVGDDGRVTRVEEYGACELDPEAIACMRNVGARVAFPAGRRTEITIPATFTSRDGVRKAAGSENDAYEAAAALSLESARAALHACATAAGRESTAQASFLVSIGRDGRVSAVRAERSTGSEVLVTCAKSALASIRFASPPPHVEHVRARLNFNPRQVAR